MRSRLLLAFIAVPLAEIWLFVVIGGRIGLAPTLLVVVATAVVGSSLVVRQGRGTWEDLIDDLAVGRFPGRTLAHGAMILVAGALLLTPGFLTDAVGFLLLVPAVRESLRRRLARRHRDRWIVMP